MRRMSNEVVQSCKAVAETSPSDFLKPPEKTPGDKAIGKRPLAPSSFEKSKVCKKKMRAEEIQDIEPFKPIMDALCQISNAFVKIAEKIAELNQDVEAAKKELAAANVVAENALKKAKDWENRAEKAEKAEKEMMRKNAELNREVETAKKELAAANGVYEKALKIAKDSYNRAEGADKAAEYWQKAFKDSSKRAEKAEKALNAVRVALITHSSTTIVNAVGRGTK